LGHGFQRLLFRCLSTASNRIVSSISLTRDDDDKARDLDEAIQDVLDTLDIPYTEIKPSEEAATWISN
jgi:hypothetical protein